MHNMGKNPTIYHLTMARPIGAGWPLVTYRRVEWGQVGIVELVVT
jgi:hypothetical protein